MAEEVEYESDQEQEKLFLRLRRRVASDDEEEGDDCEAVDRRDFNSVRRVSDCESDGQGAAAEYDDEDEDEEDSELEDYEGGEEIDSARERVENIPRVETMPVNKLNGEVVRVEDKRWSEMCDGPRDEEVYSQEGEDDELGDDNVDERRNEEKKENEPFAVPKAGAFYMHDDRFRDRSGRGRQTLRGRKLWQSKDDRKWGHDKFEEMNMQERHYEDGRRGFGGRNRGRGRVQGEVHRYSRVYRAKEYSNNNQNNTPRLVKGRGPVRYQPSTKNTKKKNEAPPQRRQTVKYVEKSFLASSERATVAPLSSESAPLPAKKHVFASSLNSASPPFYPSGSSNKEVNLAHNRDVQAGRTSRVLQPPVVGENISVPQFSSMREKNIADVVGLDKLYIDDSVSSFTRKPSNNLSLQSPVPSYIKSTRSPQFGVQGRGRSPMRQMAYQTEVPPHNQVDRVSSPTQIHTFQRASLENRVLSKSQSSDLHFRQHSVSGFEASSPSKIALPIHSLESAEVEFSSEASSSKTTLVGKEKTNIHGAGIGSLFPYDGVQIMGASGSLGGVHADKNFPFLPVMQFGGQHPRGVGVPAVGMAFPGYVAEPNGSGNPKMTWLPVLAGAAGGLGATYGSPYTTVDGAHHAHPSGQRPPLLASTEESNLNSLNYGMKSYQRPESANDELGHRRNRTRRYTQMKFEQ